MTTRVQRARKPVTPVKPPQQAAMWDVSKLQPFTWGRVPSRDEALQIAGQLGYWSYRGAMECGALYQFVLLVRYSERMDTKAACTVAPAGWVLESRVTL